jgi:hypothetical protein
MSIKELDALETGKSFAPCLDVGGDVLVDALESGAGTVVPEVGGGGEVEVVCVPCKTGAQAEREL